MQDINRLFWAAAGLLLLPFGAEAQQSARWQPTLESATRLAVQTDRLVLIHFWADGCRACQIMDREVLNQPSVASIMEASFVPVKINADYFPTTCRQYGVTTLPTDIIITPQGRQIDRLRGPLTAPEYVARLNKVAAAMKQRAAGAYAQLPGGGSPTAADRAYPPQDSAGYGFQAFDTQRPPDRHAADYYNRQRQAAASPPYLSDRGRSPVDPFSVQGPQPQQPVIPPRQTDPRDQTAVSDTLGPALQPPAGRRAADNPPLGLDGYCPVQLSDDMKANLYRWVLGDRRWGAIHRGRTYLFAGPEQQRRFLADPDRYAPVLYGDDVVIAVEQGQAVPGRREHGVLFSDRVYLFSSEASLEEFRKDPYHYAQQAFQAVRAVEGQRQQLR